MSYWIESVGLIGALPDLLISRERQLGFTAACKKENVECQVAYGDHFSREEGKRIFTQWVDEGNVPDALITTSYTLLEGVLDVMLQRPELTNQVKLATFGDNRLLDFLPFRINSLPQQFELIADSAMELALNASAKRNNPGMELIPRKIVIRD
jgi:LacI family fructose operon transcriptional repressor